MALRIPDSQKNDLATLIRLSDEDATAFELALRTAKPSMSAKALAAQISPHVRTEAATLERLIRVLYSLYGTRERFSQEVDALAAEVAEKAAEEKIGGLTPGSPAVQSFKARLSRLLGLEDSVGVGSKARDLILEQDRPFEDARVLTDIRAVFGGTATQPKPVAAMVYHTLKITAHGEEGHKTYFFALDGHEVRDLKAALERALQKEVELKGLVGKTGLPILDIQFD